MAESLYSWRECRSHYVQRLSTARWQPAMFQGLGKRGEERRGSPERVACRRRSHGSVSENEKKKGGRRPRNETSPVDEHGTVFDRQAELVARHRMKRPRVPFRQEQRRCPWRPPAGSPPPSIARDGARSGTAPRYVSCAAAGRGSQPTPPRPSSP